MINDKLTILANQFRNHINSPEKLGLYDMAYLLTTHDFSLKKQVNLLSNTDPLPSDIVNYTSKQHWCMGSSGQGVGSIFKLSDNSLRATHGFRITDNNGGNRDFFQGPIFYENGKYTFSILVRLPEDAKVSSVTSLVRIFDQTGMKLFFKFTKLITSHDWQEITRTIDASQIAGKLGANFQFGISGEGSIEYAQPMLNFGTEKAEWASNSLDDIHDNLMGGVVNLVLTAAFERRCAA